MEFREVCDRNLVMEQRKMKKKCLCIDNDRDIAESDENQRVYYKENRENSSEQLEELSTSQDFSN